MAYFFFGLRMENGYLPHESTWDSTCTRWAARVDRSWGHWGIEDLATLRSNLHHSNGRFCNGSVDISSTGKRKISILWWFQATWKNQIEKTIGKQTCSLDPCFFFRYKSWKQPTCRSYFTDSVAPAKKNPSTSHGQYDPINALMPEPPKNVGFPTCLSNLLEVYAPELWDRYQKWWALENASPFKYGRHLGIYVQFEEGMIVWILSDSKFYENFQPFWWDREPSGGPRSHTWLIKIPHFP